MGSREGVRGAGHARQPHVARDDQPARDKALWRGTAVRPFAQTTRSGGSPDNRLLTAAATASSSVEATVCASTRPDASAAQAS